MRQESERDCTALDPCLQLSVDQANDFLQQLQEWQRILTETKSASVVVSGVTFTNLVQQFNNYLVKLANKAEQVDFWQCSAREDNQNIFVPYEQGGHHVLYGYAFVPQYRESAILRRLNYLFPESGDASRFAPYEKAIEAFKRACPGSQWETVERLLLQGNAVISEVRVLSKNPDPVLVGSAVDRLKLALDQFGQEHAFLWEQLESCPLVATRFVSNVFYSISDSALEQMNGDQLLTICLEEMDTTQSQESGLVEKIIQSGVLWERVEASLHKAAFQHILERKGIKNALVDQRNEYVDKVLSRWLVNTEYSDLYLRLKEVLLEDKIFCQAILQRSADLVSVDVITDLVLLKTFYDQQKGLLDHDDSNLDNFYREVLMIRLSPQSHEEQRVAMQGALQKWASLQSEEQGDFFIRSFLHLLKSLFKGITRLTGLHIFFFKDRVPDWRPHANKLTATLLPSISPR